MNDPLLTDDPIAFLIQRGNDSLKSAEALVELDLLLDGLSRAYYAALHHARARLLSIDIIPKSHKGTLTLPAFHKDRHHSQGYRSHLLDPSEDQGGFGLRDRDVLRAG